MSRRKPAKKGAQDWQKIEKTKTAAEKENNSDLKEASAENQESKKEKDEGKDLAEEQAAQTEKNEKNLEQTKSSEKTEEPKEQDSSSESSLSKEKEQKPQIKKEAPSKKESNNPGKSSAKEKARQKARKRKYSAAVPIGGFFVLLAAIGLITVIVFGVRATENLIDNSKQKEEFENIILPVLMFDPVPFEDPNEMGDLALLRSSIWSAIIDNNEKYVIGDGNMVSVPKSDVDVACNKLFGSSVTLKHQSFEDYLSIYSFDEETQTYYVPVDATVLYTPQVEEITRNGDVFELTVGYLAPDNQWMQSIRGETSEPVPSKYMIYEMKKVEGNYQLVGIKDPPDGAVPEIPQISEQTPPPANEVPQTITPETQEQPENQEQTEPEETTKTEGDQEVAQA